MTHLRSPKTIAALKVAQEILLARLDHDLRETLGATYSPNATVERDPIDPVHTFISARLTLNPGEAEKYTWRAIEIADRLAEHGATPEEFTRALATLRTQRTENLASSDWWLNEILTRAHSQPHVLDEARAHLTVLDELTLADLNAAARQLTSKRATSTIALPGKPINP